MEGHEDAVDWARSGERPMDPVDEPRKSGLREWASGNRPRAEHRNELDLSLELSRSTHEAGQLGIADHSGRLGPPTARRPRQLGPFEKMGALEVGDLGLDRRQRVGLLSDP